MWSKGSIFNGLQAGKLYNVHVYHKKRQGVPRQASMSFWMTTLLFGIVNVQIDGRMDICQDQKIQ